MAVVLFAGAILYRIAHVQFVDGDKWRQKAQDINLQYRKVSATRGNIYSYNGSLLATSLPFYRVAMDPGIADEDVYRTGIDSLARNLAAFYKDKPASSYKRIINDARIEGRRYLVLNRRQIGYQEKQMMSEWPIFRQGRMGGGVLFEKVEKRYNPFKNLAGRTIGFLNEDHYGAGLEYSFNGYLEGKNGEALFQKIAGGTWKPVHDAEDIRPEDGYDIVTTIDINIQDVAESALLRQLMNKDAEYGCVVVMEVETGYIKAIANLEKKGSGYGYGEYYNYAIGEQGLTEPGSTFKLVSMLALLEEGKVNLKDTIDTGNGTYKFYNQTMRDAKYGGYGKLTVRQAFEKSSNVAISKLVDEHFGVAPAKFLSYVEQVGLDKPLGFQLKGEGVPYFKDPRDKKNWYGTTLPWMSIGYELKVTPLHTLTLYNAVANGGKVVKPMIVQRIQKGNYIEEKYDTEVLRKSIASDETIEQLQSLLEGVVERGTARNIANSDYKIAGKTGTAQKLINGRYTRKYYTSFAGYFPADKPKYSMIIVIDSPTGFNAYGGDVSAPVFKEIADKIYAQDLKLNKEVKPKKVKDPTLSQEVFPYIQAGKADELQMICNRFGLSNHYDGAERWVKSTVSNRSIAWRPNKVDAPLVPDVHGMTLRDALYVLENKGLRVHYSGKGRVKRQSIRAGSNVPKGGTINIELG